MSLISLPAIQDGDEANNTLFNSRFSTIVNLINGNLDQDNLLDGAISTPKIANNAVTTAKLPDGAITAVKIEAQQQWINMTLINGWVNFDPTHGTAAYMKDSLGFVHLKGLIKNGVTPNSDVFNLPVGYRPLQVNHYPTVSASAFAVIRLDSNGNLRLEGANPAWASIAVVTFKAEN